MYRIDLNSTSTPQVFLTTEHNGLPFIRVEGDTDIVVALANPVSDDELNLSLNPKPIFEPEPVHIRRQAATVEGGLPYFEPGRELSEGTVDASVGIADKNVVGYVSLTDDFGTLLFHIASPLAIGCIVAHCTRPNWGSLTIAVYDSKGERVLQTSLPGTKDGLVTAFLEPAIVLQPGSYRLAWCTDDSHLKFECWKLNIWEVGEGDVIRGQTAGRRGNGLPKQLGEVVEASWPVVRVLLKG